MSKKIIKPFLLTKPTKNENFSILQFHFKCPICLKNFSTNGNLKNHINTIHRHIFPFKCPIKNCTHSYSNKSRLNVHLRTHSGIKPYECEICHKHFNEKGNLKTHIKFHSNSRPFQCKLCFKSYKTKGHLKDHIEIRHKNVKKFVCDICKKNFGRKNTLLVHQRIHTGEKSFKCQIEDCNKKFSEKGNMIIHYKRHLKKIEKETKDIKKEKTNEIIDNNKNSINDNNIEINKNDKNDIIQKENEEILNEERKKSIEEENIRKQEEMKREEENNFFNQMHKGSYYFSDLFLMKYDENNIVDEFHNYNFNITFEE